MNVDAKKSDKFGYKHWTLEVIPRCFNVGKGRKCRPSQSSSRNHKWHAIVKRYGLRVEVCIGPISNEEACEWEIENITLMNTFSTNHSHDNSNDIGCNLTKGGDVSGEGTHRSIEQRKRMSVAQKERKRNYKHTQETRQKIGAASSLRSVSTETRNRLRILASKENLSSLTLERRSKSLSKKTIKMTLEGVVIVSFPSLKSAAKSVNGISSKLSIAIKNCKEYKGFRWRYEVSNADVA